MAKAATLTATVSCQTGFSIPSRNITPGNGNNGYTNVAYVSISTADTLTVTYSACDRAFNSAYAGQEAAYYTEDCGTFSPSPNTGTVTGLTLTYTYTPLITPANGRTRDYCDGGVSGSGDHVQYLASLSPQLTILVTAAAPDTSAPVLSSSSPADNATGVALNSNVVLTFSEPVTAVAGKNIVLKKSDGTTVETISVTGGQVSMSSSTVTVNPGTDFDFLNGYYLLIDSGAFKDAANNVYAGISSSTALNFTTLADAINPTLSSSTPADNATGVGLSSYVVLTFSEPITAVAGKNIVLKKTSDDSVVQTVSVTGGAVSVSGATVTVNPTDAFDYSTSYYVLIDSGAFKDAANNMYGGIASATALNFTTLADAINPTLSSSTPADNATGVATATDILLSFSEDVLAVSGKNITIHKSSDDAVVETISATNGSRVSIQGALVSINPASAFTNSTNYYILVDSGAFRDAAGNLFSGIAGSTDLNFSVVASSVSPTTTTIAPQSTTPATSVPVVSQSNASATTIAAGVATGSTPTTVKRSNSVNVTTTTTLAANGISKSVLTTTTTTTTSPKRPVEVAPKALAANPGEVTALINGQDVELDFSRVSNKVVVTSSAINLKLGVVGKDGAVVPLDADGNVIVDEGFQIDYAVTGAKPGAVLDIWLFSEPFKLGSVVVGDDGTVSGLLPVNVKVEAGAHRLVLKTQTASGDEATYSIGVMSGSSSGKISVSRIIFGILLAAGIAGLIIPATRRRRRSTAAY